MHKIEGGKSEKCQKNVGKKIADNFDEKKEKLKKSVTILMKKKMKLKKIIKNVKFLNS